MGFWHKRCKWEWGRWQKKFSNVRIPWVCMWGGLWRFILTCALQLSFCYCFVAQLIYSICIILNMFEAFCKTFEFKNRTRNAEFRSTFVNLFYLLNITDLFIVVSWVIPASLIAMFILCILSAHKSVFKMLILLSTFHNLKF